MRARLSPARRVVASTVADDKDLDVEKLVASAAAASRVVDYRKRTDAVFGAERNNFYRLVVL
jgi:hypothetical protein